MLGAAGDITLGKGRTFGDPADVLFVSCGAATLAVQSALALLKRERIEASAIHFNTVKPLDSGVLRRYVSAAKAVICVEEHRKIGGLSSAVLHALTTAGTPIPSFVTVGVDDAYPTGNGTYREMISHYGISGEALAGRAREFLR
jgi:transketolase